MEVILSQMWSLLGLLTVLHNVLPSQLLSLLHSLWQSLQDSLTPYSYFDIPEFLGSSAVEPNDLYRHVHLYLHHSLLSSSPPPPLPRLTLSLPRSSSPSSPPSLSLSPNHSIEDIFSGHRLVWTHHADTLHDSLDERRSFSLRLPKRHSLLLPYISHVSSVAEVLSHSSRQRRLFTNSGSSSGAAWASVPFRHPATFDTLSLDQTLKKFLISDLDSFVNGGDFYRSTGRAWKRGYLLHGSPGSGKSSLVAAIANHLHYDVYDLELTKVADNSDLRALLIQTTNRSIIVIEDIDCSLDLTGDRAIKTRKRTRRMRGVRPSGGGGATSSSGEDDDDDEKGCENGEARVTLSGLLNFTDGLWSCCGEERIIVFTTNYKGRVDPALLRPGRMDVHVRLGVCGVEVVKELVERYVGKGKVRKEMMEMVEEGVRMGKGMTAAEVGEVLLRNREEPEKAVRELVGEMQRKGVSCGSGGEVEEEEEEEEDGGWTEGSWEGGPEGKRRKEKDGWQGRVRFLGRLRSLTKSESGRRGV